VAQLITVGETPLAGVVWIQPVVHADERGFFLETYRQDVYREAGIDLTFVQDNHSRSRKGVLRGFHYQDLSAPMAKLVRCSNGAVFDVVVDLRMGSTTFGRSFALELTGENHRQLLVPVGFGHAFLTLSEQAIVEYKCSGYYDPAAEHTIAWNDPEIAASWPIPNPIVSAKDARGMTLAEYRARPAFTGSSAR
jgi:dTDP-4-dehydrorhamnose 3,5-epimerase